MPNHTEHSRESPAQAVIRFWRNAGPEDWFGKRPAFDALVREQLGALHTQASRGELDDWSRTPDGALALVLLLDQIPRNAFRGSTRMYSTDALALRHAEAAVDAGFDESVVLELRLFFYLPFAHSERIEDQRRSLELHRRLGYVGNAKRHHDIIARFERFPHRNVILGRATTREEQSYLDDGGFSG